MQSIHHVVVTISEMPINPSRLQYCQFKGSFQVKATLSVVERHETVKTWRCTCRNVVEAHRNRASGQVIGTQTPCELHVEGANCPVLVLAFTRSKNWVDFRL